MARRLSRTLILATVLALAAAPAVAQEWSGTGRITGLVTDDEGNPVQGAEVSYQMLEDRSVSPPPFVTNKKGKFSFLGIRGGQWIVVVEAEGFYKWTSPEPVEVYSTGVNEKLEAQLERIPEEELLARKRYEANQNLKKGDELRKAGKLEAAREEYQAALATLEERDHPVVLSAIADTYLRAGEPEKARTYLDQALAINPDHPGSLEGMAAIKAAAGEYQEAEELIGRLSDDTRIHPTTLLNIAMGHYNAGEMEPARGLLDTLISQNPDVNLAYYLRGLVALNLNDVETARSDLEHFIANAPADDPKVAEAQEYLGYLQAAAEAVPAGESPE
jgi:tetratricopeptide (TPR) repeat protein